MNITPELVQKVSRIAKAYDAADIKDRPGLGVALGSAVTDLTEKQCVLLAKLVNRVI